jgi:hypothetical protein
VKPALPQAEYAGSIPVIRSTLITRRRCSLAVMSVSHSRTVKLASVCPILSASSRREIKLPDSLVVAKTWQRLDRIANAPLRFHSSRHPYHHYYNSVS